MSFKLRDLKSILPHLYLLKGEQLIKEIGTIVKKSNSIEQIEDEVVKLLSENRLDYANAILSVTPILRAGEMNEQTDRGGENNPLNNEVAEIAEVNNEIDIKAEQFETESQKVSE
ncbi:MAG: hypothetical protein JSS81_19630 [Acidobacteria bacterium]|nr:hypothetical protein [Acidobacteriota bacterium]